MDNENFHYFAGSTSEAIELLASCPPMSGKIHNAGVEVDASVSVPFIADVVSACMLGTIHDVGDFAIPEKTCINIDDLLPALPKEGEYKLLASRVEFMDGGNSPAMFHTIDRAGEEQIRLNSFLFGTLGEGDAKRLAFWAFGGALVDTAGDKASVTVRGEYAKCEGLAMAHLSVISHALAPTTVATAH